MTKPDPQEFAKSVLWHLAGTRAELYQTRLLVVEVLAWLKHEPATEIQQRWQQETDAMQLRHYRESLHQAGIEDDSHPS